MNTLLLSIAYCAVAYGLYRLLWAPLQNFRFHRLLLLGIPTSALLSYFLGPILSPVGSTSLPSVALPEAISSLSRFSAEVTPQTALNGQDLLLSIYLIGLGLSAFRMLQELYQLWAVTQNSSALTELEGRIYRHRHEGPAFNFFRSIFLPASWQNDEAGAMLLAHEKAHRRLGHSYDNLYYRLLRMLFWFNPFLALLHRELQAIHEYQADAAAGAANPKRYSHYLLGQSMGLDSQTSLSIIGVNPFLSFSLIKSRIQMLQQQSPRPKSFWRYLGLAPLFLALGILLAPQLQAQKELPAFAIAEADIPPRSEECLPLSTADEAIQCFQEEWMNYIQENFKAPKALKSSQLVGTCYVGFVVNTKGQIEQVEVLRGLAPKNAEQEAAAEGLNQYLGRFFNSRPAYIAPAEKDDKAVAIQFVIPIKIHHSAPAK